MNSQKGSKIKIFNATTGKFEEVEKIVRDDKEWEKMLPKEQFCILRQKSTEMPFSDKLLDNKKQGIYRCGACGTDLFTSTAKFDSGTGWPSFFRPVDNKNISFKEDLEFGVKRIEVLCSRCDAHLGHVFDDGPPPTYKRYCINGGALKFVEIDKPSPSLK